MWFKNLQIFKFAKDFELTADLLQEKLQQAPYQPCLPVMAETMGFVNPLLEEETRELIYPVENFILFCLKTEKKILPSSVIKDHLKEAVGKIEKVERRKVYKREKEALQDEIVHRLLPKAFSRTQKIFGYIDNKTRCVVINHSSREQAERVLHFMRKQLGSFPLVPLVNESPARMLTQWLVQQNPPADIVIGDSCVLQNPRHQQGQIRIKRQALESDSILSLIRVEHFQLAQLSIHWREQISGVVTHDFSVHQIQYGESVQATAGEVNHENLTDKLSADFIIMAHLTREFIQAIVVYFEQWLTKQTKQSQPEEEAVA